MLTLEKFQKHLDSVSHDAWQCLFQLLPDLDKYESFNQNEREEQDKMEYVQNSKLVIDVLKMLTDLKLCPVFDWTTWDEGKNLLKNLSTDYSRLDPVTLCQLLTYIIRANRFNEGFLMACFERGIIKNIILGLQNSVEQK